MRWLLSLCVLVCAWVMYLVLVEPVTPYEPSPKTQEEPISLKGGYWGDAETPEYFLLWDFWFYEKPSIWALNSWIPFDRYTGNVHIQGSGVVSASAVPARLSFTDDVDLTADLQLHDYRLNVSGTVFATDARKEVDGVLY